VRFDEDLSILSVIDLVALSGKGGRRSWFAPYFFADPRAILI
jgi:hypothetical protein